MGHSLVTELRSLASDSHTSVSELLRKALVVATKLKIGSIQSWLHFEINGYRHAKRIPIYRLAAVHVMARGFLGCQHVIIRDRQLAEACGHAPIFNSVAELERGISDKENWEAAFPPEIAAQITQGMIFPGQAFQQIPSNELTRILETVRGIILQWALKLEQDGITGDGMKFSNEEENKAAQSPVVQHIQNFVNGDASVVGNIQAHNVNIGDYGSIRESLKEAGFTREQRNELEDILDDLKKAKEEDKPGIVQRGMDWVKKNKTALTALGALGAKIAGWFSVEKS